NSLQQEVGRTEDLVFGYPQHTRGGFVVPGHFRFPIGQAIPRSRFPHFLGRRKQGAGVGDGSAAHRTTMVNDYMAEQPHIEEAAQAEFWPPKPAMEGPTGV